MASSPAHYVVKIIVSQNKGGSEESVEIKKFQVPCDLSTDYSYIIQKIRSYYDHGGIKLFWTDSDGDEITIDSDEDLRTAKTEVTGESLKFKVILQDKDQGKLNAEDDDAMELDDPRGETREDRGQSSSVDVGQKSVVTDGNYILSLMVYTVQCLGLDPCGPHQSREVSVPSYLIRVAAGLTTKLTKSMVLMSSVFLLTVLSMFLPSYVTNSIIYFILAFSLGLPIATLLLGHFLYGLISVSPNFVVTFLSMWALRTLLYRNRQQLLRLNLDYWNKRLEQTLQDEMTRNNRPQ